MLLKATPKLILASLFLAAGFVSHAYGASIRFNLELPDGGEPPNKKLAVVLIKEGESAKYETLVDDRDGSLPYSKEFSNLSAGKYVLLAYVSERSPGLFSAKGDFNSQSRLTLKEGESKEVSLVYEPFDPGDLVGEKTFEGILKSHDGYDVRNARLYIVARSQDYEYSVAKVVTDSFGKFKIPGLSEKQKYYVFYKFKRFGSIDLSISSKGEIILPPFEGDLAPNIAFKKLDGLADVQLSDFSGKVVVLEFWATWCGPCQDPMDKMNTYREKYPDWGDRVELIALSVDRSKASLDAHIQKRNWVHVYHGWTGEEAFQSDPAMTYKVSGVPDCLVIDQSGKIARRGHPAGLDIPDIVGGLLKKEGLSLTR